MNRWIRKAVTLASIAGTLSLLPGGVALADAPAEQGAAAHPHHHLHLMADALKLGSLSGEQRSKIQALEQSVHGGWVPVRQADAQVLTALAQQVEQGAVDRGALQGSLDAETSAAHAVFQTDLGAVTQLHDLLTPAQRGELVDAVEAMAPGHARPGLEAFRGGDFAAQVLVHEHVPGAHAIAMAEARVPSMTPEQRSALAAHLRQRASHESES